MSQEGSGLLFQACKEGHLGDVEYLQSMGGKELLMATDSVSQAYMHACVCIYIHDSTGVKPIQR
jgi:hypothetical protein